MVTPKNPATDGEDKKKAGLRRYFVRGDYNVLENPVFDVDNKSDAKTMCVTKSVRRGNDTVLTTWITRSERELPKAFDKKVLYVFLRLFEEQGYPADGRVRFTFYEVAKHLGQVSSGDLCRRIEEAVHRLRAMTIEACNSWFDGELKAFQQDKVLFIQMIADAYFSRPSVEGQIEVDKSWVQLGAHIQGNVRSGAVKMLNMEVVMSIKSPLALRLFEILSKRRNKASTHNTQLSKLAESIPMKPAAVSRHLQLLKGPHAELVEKGIIADVKVTGEGKNKVLIYTFPSGENVTITAAEARRIEAIGSETVAASVDLDSSQPLKPEDLDLEVCFLIGSLHRLPASKTLELKGRSYELIKQFASVDRLLPVVKDMKVEFGAHMEWPVERMMTYYLDRLKIELLQGSSDTSGPED